MSHEVKELYEFLMAMPTSERNDFAINLPVNDGAGTSAEYLYQVAKGWRRASTDLALAIEGATKDKETGISAVPAGSLRPDVWGAGQQAA